MRHYVSEFIYSPNHAVKIAVIGAGGTGSQFLSGLARMDVALRKLGHLGLKVYVYDPDKITEANIGRQMFSSSEIGHFKSDILVTRINRFFGLGWMSIPEEFKFSKYPSVVTHHNIIVTCVDNVKTRKYISDYRYDGRGEEILDRERNLYWLDMGNSKTTGQVILSTMNEIKQPQSKYQVVSTLPDIFEIHGKIKESPSTPSCSLIEALDKQDLFINSVVSQFGLALLWKMFREYFITVRGCYINLDTFKINPIKI